MPADDKLPASKGDLRAVEVALKSDIDAVRTELKSDITRVVVELAQTKAELKRDIVALTERIEHDNRTMTGRLDSFLNKMETVFRESATTPRIMDSHAKQLQNHEARLTSLETKSS